MIPTFTIVLLGAGAQVEPPAPIPPLPSEPQLAWHAEPYYAFVHFNMNTFTDREWGKERRIPISSSRASSIAASGCACSARRG